MSPLRPPLRPLLGSARTLAAGVLGLLLVVLCGLAPVGSATALPRSDADGDTPPGSGWIRTGQFVEGLEPVEIELAPRSGSAMTLGDQVSYGEVSPYRQVTPGVYTVGVRPESAGSSSAPMLRRTLTVKAGTAGTVALLGTEKAPRLATLTDDLTSPATGSSRVRVISGSSNADGLRIKAVNGPLIATDVVLGQTTPYATVPDGDWTLRLTRKGAAPVQAPITLGSGAVYTAVVLDARTEDGIRMSLVTDAQGARTMPKGGAATGGGGTAPRTTGSVASWWLVLAAAALGGVAVLLSRGGYSRPTPRR